MMKKSKRLSIHLNILFALTLLLTSDFKTRHEMTNFASRTGSFLGSTLCVHLGTVLLTLLVSLLFLREGLDLVGVENTLLTTLDPVVVAGVVVEDLLVQEVSSLSEDLDVASYRDTLLAR
jgi:hypothetical protein